MGAAVRQPLPAWQPPEITLRPPAVHFSRDNPSAVLLSAAPQPNPTPSIPVVVKRRAAFDEGGAVAAVTGQRRKNHAHVQVKRKRKGNVG